MARYTRDFLELMIITSFTLYTIRVRIGKETYNWGQTGYRERELPKNKGKHIPNICENNDVIAYDLDNTTFKV